VYSRNHVRLFVLYIVVATMMVVLLGRLWTMQVLEGAHYQGVASSNRTRDIVVPPVRGQILDDMGRPLVRNRTSLVVSVDRTALMRQKDGGKAVLGRLAAVLGTTEAKLAQQIRLCGPGVTRPCWQGSPYQPIPVDDKTSAKQALQIMERQEDFPGISAQVQAVREYPRPDGASAVQTLGYLSPITQEELDKRKGLKVTGFSGVDLIGRDGLEAEYDSDLRGTPGIRRLNVDSKGQVTGVAGEQPAVSGGNLVTSLDAKVQGSLESAIQREVDKAHKKGLKAPQAAGVVMDVHTGRVVALASYPSYDPSVWIGGISQSDYDALLGRSGGQPLISRAVQGEFPPGSTFKISSLAAAVSDGYSLHGSYDCPSSLDVGNRAFHNSEGQGHGVLSLKQAITVSCDTIFYRFGYEEWQRDGSTHPVKNPKDPMVRMARAFGFGTRTGIDLPNESSGRIPDRQWKLDYWKATKTSDCKHAKTGYPDESSSKNAYLTAIARENCVDGYLYRAGDAANFAVGQGDVLVTPLQLARAYAAVANGGTLVTPRIGKAIVRSDGTVIKQIPPAKPAGKLPVPQSVLKYLRSALATVPATGTAAVAFKDYDMSKAPVAGKTGTSQVYGQSDTALFASYAPVSNPQLVTVVVISQSGFGATYAAPAVRATWETVFGLAGQPAALPGGKPPVALPRFRSDGSVAGVPQ
jgi:penicillin-binding protein 2